MCDKLEMLCLQRGREGEIHCTCSLEFDEDFKPHNGVELIIDEKFIDGCINDTNAHGANDPNFLSKVGILGKMKKGRSFINPSIPRVGGGESSRPPKVFLR